MAAAGSGAAVTGAAPAAGMSMSLYTSKHEATYTIICKCKVHSGFLSVFCDNCIVLPTLKCWFYFRFQRKRKKKRRKRNLKSQMKTWASDSLINRPSQCIKSNKNVKGLHRHLTICLCVLKIFIFLGFIMSVFHV